MQGDDSPEAAMRAYTELLQEQAPEWGGRPGADQAGAAAALGVVVSTLAGAQDQEQASPRGWRSCTPALAG